MTLPLAKIAFKRFFPRKKNIVGLLALEAKDSILVAESPIRLLDDVTNAVEAYRVVGVVADLVEDWDLEGTMSVHDFVERASYHRWKQLQKFYRAKKL